MANDDPQKALKVLVVDDDKELVSGFLALLQEEGFEAYAEYNGLAAVETLKERVFDAVFVDALLPNMDGFQVCEKLRWIKGYSKVPVVMISGVFRSGTHASESIAKYKLFDYIEKPIPPVRIIRVLRKIFGKDYPKRESQGPGDTGRGRSFIENSFYLYSPSQIPLAGKMDEVPFPVIVNQLYERRLSGMLMILWGKAKKVITFEKGKPIGIASNIISECLGQIMLREHEIGEEMFRSSFELLKKTGRKHGDLLVELGAITPYQRSEALKKQLDLKLNSVFNWRGASFSFKNSPNVPAPHSRLDAHPFVLLRNGIMNKVKEETLLSWMRPYATSAVRAADDASERMNLCGYNLKEIRYIQQLDGSETLDELLDSPIKNRKEMLPFLMHLIVIQALTLDQPSWEEVNLEEEEENSLAGGIRQRSAMHQHAKHLLEKNKEAEQDVSKTSTRTKALGKEQLQKMEMMLAVQKMDEDQKAHYLRLYKLREEMAGKDYFTLLDVDQKVKPDIVKEKFRQLAKEFHPDAIAHSDITEIRQLADQIFTTYSKAAETLSNSTKKSEYIKEMSEGGNEDATEEVAKILAAEQFFFDAQNATRKKDWTTAKRHLQEAIKLNPNEGEFFAELGWVHFNMSTQDLVTRQEAVRYLEKAIELNEKLSNAYFYMGTIYKAIGDTNKAAEWFLKTLQVDKKHSRAQSEVRLLKMRKQEEMNAKKKKGVLSSLLKR